MAADTADSASDPASIDAASIDALSALAGRVAGADLAARIRFAAELDRLRLVERRSYIAGGVRLENSGEHSWHVATMALVLAPFLGAVDVGRVVQMLLLHDVVEIDAGDASIYDASARAAKHDLERQAADRLYGLLPASTGSPLRALWDEYEAGATAEARAAAAMDRLAPLLLNWLAAGRTWQDQGVAADRVRAVNLPVAQAVSPDLAAVVAALIDDAVSRGWLPAT